jgi:hypothetical protein
MSSARGQWTKPPPRAVRKANLFNVTSLGIAVPIDQSSSLVAVDRCGWAAAETASYRADPWAVKGEPMGDARTGGATWDNPTVGYTAAVVPRIAVSARGPACVLCTVDSVRLPLFKNKGCLSNSPQQVRGPASFF